MAWLTRSRIISATPDGTVESPRSAISTAVFTSRCAVFLGKAFVRALRIPVKSFFLHRASNSAIACSLLKLKKYRVAGAELEDEPEGELGLEGVAAAAAAAAGEPEERCGDASPVRSTKFCITAPQDGQNLNTSSQILPHTGHGPPPSNRLANRRRGTFLPESRSNSSTWARIILN